MLLRNRPVYEELALDTEQIESVNRQIEPLELKLWQLRDQPASMRNGLDLKLYRQFRRGIARILSPEQYRRLGQIVFQAQDIHGLLDPVIKSRLNLSDTQVTQIGQILSSLNNQFTLLQNHSESRQTAEKIQTLQSSSAKQIIGILTENQIRILPQLRGKPFDFTPIRQRACKAPEFKGVTTWLNSESTAMKDLKGKVVALHFYAAGCINCKRNLPHYNRWAEMFSSDGLCVIGIHRPEFEQERDVDTVRKNADEYQINYPVAIDNDSENWTVWGNSIWPSVYLIDKEGFVRYWWYGELNWQGNQGELWMRKQIQYLLNEKTSTSQTPQKIRL
jgi:peroxiredoxin